MLFNQLKIIENTPTIETERLILRKCTFEDAENFLYLLSDEETNTFLPWFTIKTLEDAREHINNRYLLYYQKPSAYRYVICLKTDNKPIGYVCVSEGNSYDLGYGLRKEFWHKGIVTEASKAVIDRLKNAGFTYITATHDINNPRSGKVMQKLGMKYCYTYIEQCQPKNIIVTFMMYQLNFNSDDKQVYMGYWNKYPKHFTDVSLI